MGAYIFLSLILMIAVIIVNYFVAIKFSEIAEMKGHTDICYFWYTFLLGIVGMLMVIALPNNHIAPPPKNISYNTPSQPYSAPAQNEEETKTCPKCGCVQKANRKVCWSCGTTFEN